MIVGPAIQLLLDGRHLAREDAHALMGSIMDGEATPAQVAGFLVALRTKGETADEIAGFADAMREHVVPVAPERSPVVDVVGTGGDGAHTFNISTAAALVAAAAGAAVAKHGNRAASSQAGSADVLDDTPSTALLPQVRRNRARFKVRPAASVSYIYLNHRLKPFRDIRVRRAVGLALDDRAILRTIGGFGSVTCNFLPPAMPGYRAIRPCPFGSPSGSPLTTKARALVAAAGATGTRVDVWNTDTSPYREQTLEVVRELRGIGLRARARLLPPDAYFTQIATPSSNAQLVMSGWIQDFPHPADFFLLVDGRSITPSNNQNTGEVDDPVLSAGIARLSRVADLGSVTAQWARLDRRVIEQAHVVPIGLSALSVLGSRRMDIQSCALIHPVYANDYTSWCLKP